jgi:hypothetical protein
MYSGNETRTQLQLLITAGLERSLGYYVDDVLFVSGLTASCPHSEIFTPCPDFV